MTNPVDLEALAERLKEATPGPWHWAGNVDTGEPYLASWAPGLGRTSVLAIGWEPRSTTGRAADQVRSYASESGMDEDEAVDMWANDQYGEPIKEPRLWFYRDHMAVNARDLVTFEVAPTATTRDDPKVYRADITDIRHPDAQLIVELVNAAPALLAELVELRTAREAPTEGTHDTVTLGVPGATSAMAGVVADIVRERVAQEEKWGQQNHPDGTGPCLQFDELPLSGMLTENASMDAGDFAEWARQRCEDLFANSEGTYEAILTEEVAEAYAENDPVALRAELVQVAAVAAAWVEKLDREAAAR